MSDIKLVPHSANDPIMKIIQERRTKRDYKPNTELTDQELSDLLWVTYGENKAAKAELGGILPKKTVPSACALYPIKVYAFLKKGAYEYISEKHELKLIKKGDFMEKTGGQDFVKDSSVNLVFFLDWKVYQSGQFAAFMKGETGLKWASMDCGIISENIYLYCASKNLKTCVRGMAGNEKELRGILGLDDKCQLIFAQSVGK